MRIALITGGMPLGGTTTFCLFLAAGLQKLGVDCKLFNFSSGHPLRQEFTDLGIDVHLEDERRLIFEDRLARIYGAVREFNPTAVFAVLGADSFELLRYVPPGVLRVGMIHDHHPPVYELLRTYRSVCDRAVAVAASIAEQLRRELPDLPCAYLQHGVLFKDAHGRAANPDEPLKLLFFGRFDQGQKQVLIFPSVYADLKKRNVQFRWTIHGEGPAEEALRQGLAGGLKAGEIRFSAPVHYEKLGGIIRQHDVCVIASLHEAGPLTLIEAMGRGLVPVCSDIPCLIQEIVTPRNGFRVRVDDPEAYAGAIAQLEQNRSLLEQLSGEARRTIDREFSAEAMARRYVQFVEEHQLKQKTISWPARIAPKPILLASGPVKLAQASGLLRQVRRLAKRAKSLPTS